MLVLSPGPFPVFNAVLKDWEWDWGITLLFYSMRLSSLEDLEADLVEVTEFAVSEACLLEAGGVPLLLISEVVDCWLSLRGRIKPREYSKKKKKRECVCV